MCSHIVTWHMTGPSCMPGPSYLFDTWLNIYTNGPISVLGLGLTSYQYIQFLIILDGPAIPTSISCHHLCLVTSCYLTRHLRLCPAYPACSSFTQGSLDPGCGPYQNTHTFLYTTNLPSVSFYPDAQPRSINSLPLRWDFNCQCSLLPNWKHSMLACVYVCICVPLSHDTSHVKASMWQCVNKEKHIYIDIFCKSVPLSCIPLFPPSSSYVTPSLHQYWALEEASTSLCALIQRLKGFNSPPWMKGFWCLRNILHPTGSDTEVTPWHVQGSTVFISTLCLRWQRIWYCEHGLFISCSFLQNKGIQTPGCLCVLD